MSVEKMITYEIMHMERLVATINTSGKVTVVDTVFMPYDLYFETEEDIDTRVNNLNNFYYWCATRVLSLDRTYAKEILNCLGMMQAVTDRDRATIALSYHCVSLTDVYWVKAQTEQLSYEEINLYEHSLNEAIVDLSLKGKQMTVTNQEMAPDLSTKGVFPKAWIRKKDGFYLLKDGGNEAVDRELLASQICRCFDVSQVLYELTMYKNEPVTMSKIVTSMKYSMVSKLAFDVYAANHELRTLDVCVELDKRGYYGMNILDYLVGNTDRHPENWGFLIDNATNQYMHLYPLMDFNHAFQAYDTIDGANCQTSDDRKQSQKDAAMEAVNVIGLPQLKEVDMNIFQSHKEWGEMFTRRYQLLKSVCN